MSEPWRVLADVGGTNIRFGRVREDDNHGTGPIEDLQVWPAASFANFEAALDAYLETIAGREDLSSVVVAAAGPVVAGAIQLTNRDWAVTAEGVHHVAGFGVPLRVLNDLEAVAHALPFLPEAAVDWWDGVRPPEPAYGRRLAVNVGTGFGSAAIIHDGGQWVCCPAEAGHMQLGAADAGELALLARFDPGERTVEGMLSGDGVRRLRGAVAAERRAGPVDGDDTFDFAARDPLTVETRELFARFLARSAANLVLASAAWDGVYLCGSVALAWAEHGNRGAFRDSFCGTAKMRDRLAETPIGVIKEPFPAFIGLAKVRVSQGG